VLKRILVWFRRDLRLHDHAALWQATQDAAEIVPVFVLDPAHFANREVGSGRVAFLLACLADLDQSLRRRGSSLLLLKGAAQDVLPRARKTLDAQAIYYSTDIERWSGQQRDRALTHTAKREGWLFKAYLNYYLQTDDTYDRDAWNAAWTAHSKARVLPAPERVNTPDIALSGELPTFKVIPTLADLGLSENQQEILPGGETAARARLQDFLHNRIASYRSSISKPIVAEDDGTSRLSPYFKFGCISQRSAIQAARKRYVEVNASAGKGLEAWVSRLRWRDHFVQKFALYPQAEFVNLYKPFDAIRQPERIDTDRLQAWQTGRTGFPLVDASMRALRLTGLLNFRMRAMLATFLSLNLMHAWQHGAEWFMEHLLDGDATVDHWQWQMQAGITQPNRSFVRCYNPTKQCIDNDPDARFIHKYVPELRSVPAPLTFTPWKLTALEQALYGVRIGKDYPAPIIDADETRRVALAAVQPIREQLAAAERLDDHLNHLSGITPLLSRSLAAL
jgi:deoxyribodipyrimidine photo-lyase